MKHQDPLVRRSYRHKKPRKIQSWQWTLFLLAIITIIGLAFSAINYYNGIKMQKEIATATNTLLTQAKQTQDKADLTMEAQVHKNKAFTSISFLPAEQTVLPFKNLEKTYQTFYHQKSDHDSKLPPLFIGSVQKKKLTDELARYTVIVTTYEWDKKEHAFQKIDSKTTQSAFVNTTNQHKMNAKELIQTKANLLGIQQIVKNELLKKAKNPDQIIDAVIALPDLSWKTKMTYHQKYLEIKVPLEGDKTTTVKLSYNQIKPFIQTQLVDPKVLKKDTPKEPEDKKYLALTFDDGPNPQTTPDILNILAKEKVKATFFLLGKNVEQAPNLVKQAKEQGHELASHSYSHPFLPNLTNQQVSDEVQKTDKAIYNAIGELPQFLRPPYGAVDENTAQRIGKPIIQWNVDSLDWQSKNKNAILSVIKQTVAPNSIVLLHDIQPATVEALPEVIAYLKKENYTLVTISELLGHQAKPMHQYFGKDDERKI